MVFDVRILKQWKTIFWMENSLLIHNSNKIGNCLIENEIICSNYLLPIIQIDKRETQTENLKEIILKKKH